MILGKWISRDEEKRKLNVRCQTLERALRRQQEINRELTKQLNLKDKIIKQQQIEIDQLKVAIAKLELTMKTYQDMVFDSSKKKDKTKDTNPPTFYSNNQKRGGKKGHKGKGRIKAIHIDRQVEVKFEKCPNCAGPLCEYETTVSHIVEDIVFPIMQKIVTEYVKKRQWCANCKSEFVAYGKDEVANSRFGVNLTGLMLIMRYKMHLSLQKISYLLTDLSGIEITKPAIQNNLEKARERFNEAYKDILTQVRGSPVKHADETTWKVAGEKTWLWAFTTEKVTYLTAQETRGGGVAEDCLDGCDPSSVLVRDDYAGYTKLDLKQQSCWAHLLRKSRDYAKLEGSCEKIKDLEKELTQLYEQIDEFINKPEILKKQRNHEYRKQLNRLTEIAKRGYADCEACKRVVYRIKKQKENLLTAIRYKGVPLTNNQAERDLRKPVLMRKITGGSQSKLGAETTAVNMSVVQTIDKLGLNLVTEISNLLLGGSLNFNLSEKG